MSGNHSQHGHTHSHQEGHGHSHRDGHVHHHHDLSAASLVQKRPRSLPHPQSRRAFLGQLGRGTLAMAVVAPAVLAACSSGSASGETATSDMATNGGTASEGETAPAATAPAGQAAAEAPPASESLTWARTNLGFVSAYVLVRGNAAAIVDTGSAGSAAAIGETLNTLGLNYSDVAHVILTHRHGDHIGSINEVLADAVNAQVYAGELDREAIPGDISGVTGGEDIFGFEVLPTPGHTAGHISVIDHQAGLLVAGDSIFTNDDGQPVEGPARFFDDVPQSRESIKAMAALTFNTLLVGHGAPIETGADAAVAALAASL